MTFKGYTFAIIVYAYALYHPKTTVPTVPLVPDEAESSTCEGTVEEPGTVAPTVPEKPGTVDEINPTVPTPPTVPLQPRTLVLDFETFYSKDFTLKKLTTEAYIRGDRFEPLVLVVKPFGSGTALTLRGEQEIEGWVQAQHWPAITVIAHNAAFDAGILSYRYGAIPAAIRCTMSLARGVLGLTKEGASLEALAKQFGLPGKMVPYGLFMGKRWADMGESLRLELAEGCLRDVEITEALALRFLDSFPERELEVIDMTIRMATEPRLVADPRKLYAIAEKHHARKADRMAALGVMAKQLNSAKEFVTLFEEAGEIVLTKPNKKQTAQIPAIAKSDPFMQELADEDGLAGDSLQQVAEAVNFQCAATNFHKVPPEQWV